MDGNSRSTYIQPISCKNKEVYLELNSLIYEYLEVNGLEQALQTFTKECQSKNLPCPKPSPGTRDSKSAFTHYDGEQLLKSFDDGDLDTFLKLWKRFQTHIQVTSEDMKKLEVYLQVHFAIWPKAKNQSETRQNQAMQTLKAFFEEHSASLSSDATILPLFALPFVPDPRPHPIFKDLFQDSWTSKLRAQLETTVNKYFELLQENITTHCKLASVVVKSKRALSNFHQNPGVPSSSAKKLNSKASSGSTSVAGGNKISKPNNGNNSEIASNIILSEAAVFYHQDRFFQLLGIHKRTRKSLRGMRENYGKLLKICAELIAALEKTDGENKTSSPLLDTVLQKCVQIYPEIFTSSTETTVGSKVDLAYFKTIVATTVIDKPLESEVSLLFMGILDIGPNTINYDKVKDGLMSDKVSLTDKLCLLQALRWMITKTSSVSRNQVMETFVSNDVLGITTNKSESRHKLFSCMLSPNPTYQKESLARLINAFASTWTGRGYLVATEYVIDILIKSLSTFKSQQESFICHMVIATLQKLSLRKAMRRTMIEQNVIPWLVKYIKAELDRDLIRDEVNQMTIDWKSSNADGVSATVDIENNQCPIGGINGNNSSVYGDSFNIYLMEYAWALLMNLCLHEESIKSALIVDFEFLHCIVAMLTCKCSFEFTPYVLSTLFSLLRNPEMFEKAKTMNLDKKLGPIVDRQSADVASHLKHLLSQLYHKDNVDRLTASGETDYDGTDNPDPEDVETELELPESWMNNQTDLLLTGDDLLIREYLSQREISFLPSVPPATEEEPNHSMHTITPNSVDSTTAVGLILRPTTPTRNILKNPRTNNNNPTCIPASNPASQPQQEVYLKSRPKPAITQTTSNTSTTETLNLASLKVLDGWKKRSPQVTTISLPHPVPCTNPLLQQGQMSRPLKEYPQLVPFTTIVESTASETSAFNLHESPAVSFPAGIYYRLESLNDGNNGTNNEVSKTAEGENRKNP